MCMEVISRTAGPTSPPAAGRSESGQTLAHTAVPAARNMSCSVTNISALVAASACICGVCQPQTTSISTPQNTSAAAGVASQRGHRPAQATAGATTATARTCASMCSVKVFVCNASSQLVPSTVRTHVIMMRRAFTGSS